MANTLKYTDGTGPAFVDGTTGKAATFDVQAQTADRVYAVPDASGTLLIDTDLSAYAPLASPTFTGTPLAPTAAEGTRTTQIATTDFALTAAYGADNSPNPDTPITGDSLTWGVFDAPVNVLTIQPAGTLATLTVALSDGAYGGQVAFMCFTQIITALTVTDTNFSADGLTLPTAAALGQTFGFVWNADTPGWQRFL